VNLGNNQRLFHIEFTGFKGIHPLKRLIASKKAALTRSNLINPNKMSDRDTDDTDVLLAADPNGGLEMFLGLSLSELTEKHRKILTPGGNNVGAVSNGRGEEDVASDLSFTEQDKANVSNATVSNLELDSSDFFNSKGELVLSGLSEWTASDDSDRGDGDESRTSNADVHSDAESVSSFTYENASVDLRKEESGVDEVGSATSKALTGSGGKDLEGVDNRDSCNVGNNNEKGPEGTEIEEVIEVIGNQDEGAYPHGGWTSMFQSFSTNLNLYPGQTFQPNYIIPQFSALGQAIDINLLRPSSGWNIPLPRFPNGNHQMFTRAPNFR
jgi:hypothetical protein